jgi:Subtilase family
MIDSTELANQPILLTSPTGRREFNPPSGGSKEKTKLPGRARQVERLSARFADIERALEQRRVVAQTSLPAADPELVVVFETRGKVAEVFDAARKAGLELLVEVEDEFEPDEEFQKGTAKPADVPGFLHVALTSARAMRQLLELWEMWSRGEPLKGFGGKESGLASLFKHLKDVRPWGPADRVRATGLTEAIQERITEGIGDVPVEVELWYYQSAERRQQSETAMRETIVAVGGQVVRVASHEGFGYQGIAGIVPIDALRPLLDQGPDAVTLLRSDDVFLMRPGGQSVPPPADIEPGEPGPIVAAPPSGSATVALLDGLPVTNHIRLDGRVSVMDSDGLDDGTYQASLRRHGTEMASLIAWGDLAADEEPLQRPILVRPILKPDLRTRHGRECVPDGMLLPDVMVRVVRELLGAGDQEGTAPDVRILNLSVGDPHAPFDTVPSAWARALDWLAAEYGILVVVSAGNHLGPLVIDVPRADFQAAERDEQRTLVLDALAREAVARRLLTPAESINAVTVGALHADSAGDYVAGQRMDPLSDAAIPSAISAIGRGFRRSVKPEVFREGGRQLFRVDPAGSPASTRLLVNDASAAPGLRAACPTAAEPTRGEVHTRGTSGAAALTTRRAAELLDLIEALRVDVPGFEDRHVVPALKALLVHASEWPDKKLVSDALTDGGLDRYFGYGWLALNHVLGCPPHAVTLLAVGDLGARQEEDILLPLPPGLSGLRGKQRVTATLAWMSPINWRHRQYRRAKLAFGSPKGPLASVVSSKQVRQQRAQRGTVQHEIFEGLGAVPIGPADEQTITVQCYEQAGGLNGATIPYGIAISLQVAPELDVRVYQEVAARVRPAVVVAPRP